MKPKLAAFVLTAVGMLTCSQAAAQKLPVWEEAHKTWEAAMSQYSKQMYDQAEVLLGEFVKKYSRHEYVSSGYLIMAYCRLRKQDREGWEQAIDQVIKKFPIAGAWFIAHSQKLGWYHQQGKNDQYVDLFESMLRKCKEMPFDMTSIYHDYPRIWYAYNSRRRATGGMPWIWEGLNHRGIEHDLLDMCDTPERADKALRALAHTFKKRDKEMPPEWEFTHYMLLRLAGKDREADKAIKDYQAGWGKDPRGIGLWVLIGEYAQDANDDKTADMAYQTLQKDYASYGSLAYYLGPRLEYLKNHDRYEDFVATAEFYLKRFPRGHFRDDLFDHWLAMLRPRVVGGGEDAYRQAVKVLDRYKGQDSYYAIKWLVSRNLEMKKPAEALKLAGKLLDEKYWSAETFQLLQGYVRSDKSLGKLVDDARKKYKIPAADPSSPAAALLKELEGRIKDEQERHMEEVGQKMVSAHLNDDATIQGVYKLVEYYFNKLMPEQRDKWAGRMISSYPKHPLTQRVLMWQATAMHAAKKYDVLATTLDTLRERFPTCYYREWVDHRMECYVAAKDLAGKAAFARKLYGADADAGDLRALADLAKHELPVFGKDTQQIGDYWTKKAAKMTDTYGKLYCLYRAIDGYCYLWTADWLRDRWRSDKDREFLWDRGMDAVRACQARKEDPEFSYYLEFANITLLFEKGDGRGAMSAAKEQFKGKYRDLSARVNLIRMTRALGDPNTLTREALVFGRKLNGMVHTLRDRNVVNSFMASLYGSLQMYPQAFKHYVDIINDCPWPAKVYGAYTTAVLYTRGNAGQANALAQSYLSKIGNVQDLAPRVLYYLAYAFHGNAAAFTRFGSMLVQRYPESMSRMNLVKLAEQQRQR
ncbi:MAG TPA: hypothetical protein VNA25_15935 [Phycisphaerae bacterium]|nr:hypothetical protein [Phycisphaerae bacterium]HUT59339.1 hypothetical protein [Phycisphaerae bacterium]